MPGGTCHKGGVRRAERVVARQWMLIWVLYTSFASEADRLENSVYLGFVWPPALLAYTVSAKGGGTGQGTLLRR